MKQVVVEQFGGPETLAVQNVDTPEPGPGEARVRLRSIGMNHAELMARRGEYRLISGDPPFVPGLEAGGVVEALGPGVSELSHEQRVTLSPAAPRLRGAVTQGTYRSHFIAPVEHLLPVPDRVPDQQLGTLWLPHLTAWGCLVWKQQLQPGQWVGIPAASSSVGLAAGQIVKAHGGTAVGFTSHPEKAERLRELDACAFDHLIVTHEADRSLKPWHREIRELTEDRGIDVFFDPVAAGAYLESEVKSLATGGTVWIYGLLGGAGAVDLTPLIRKRAAIRGFALTELIQAGVDAWRPGCDHILQGFADGRYCQHVGQTFALDDVRQAHEFMEQGGHIGKLVLLP